MIKTKFNEEESSNGINEFVFVNDCNKLKIAHKNRDLTATKLKQSLNKYEKLKITTLNANSITKNAEYVNILSLESDILYLTELMSPTMEVITEVVASLDKKIYFFAAKKKKKYGRFSGGSAFVINKDIESKCTEINERIQATIMNELVVIGVYLAFNDQSEQMRDQFDADMLALEQYITTWRSKMKEVVIIGDFNTDFTRRYHYFNSLTRMMRNTHLIAADLVYPQLCDFTYFKKVRNPKESYVTSWIDHILTHDSLRNINSVSILSSLNNIGYHYAVTIE